MDTFFIWASAFAFFMAIVWLIVSSAGLFTLIVRIIPLLTETKDNIQDLGDLTANTVGRASDTMDLVELRVSQAMGSAAEAGSSVTKQALSVGTLLVSAYMAVRIVGMLYSQSKSSKSKRQADPRKEKQKR